MSISRIDLERLWTQAKQQDRHAPDTDLKAYVYTSDQTASAASMYELGALYRMCLKSPNPTLREAAKQIKAGR